jgi:hypothetical protein
MVLRGQPDVIATQAAHRGLSRGQRCTQVVADRDQQRHPHPVGLHSQGISGQPAPDRRAGQGTRPPHGQPPACAGVFATRRRCMIGPCRAGSAVCGPFRPPTGRSSRSQPAPGAEDRAKWRLRRGCQHRQSHRRPADHQRTRCRRTAPPLGGGPAGPGGRRQPAAGRWWSARLRVSGAGCPSRCGGSRPATWFPGRGPRHGPQSPLVSAVASRSRAGPCSAYSLRNAMSACSAEMGTGSRPAIDGAWRDFRD